jgi:hypothetical protein
MTSGAKADERLSVLCEIFAQDVWEEEDAPLGSVVACTVLTRGRLFGAATASDSADNVGRPLAFSQRGAAAVGIVATVRIPPAAPLASSSTSTVRACAPRDGLVQTAALGLRRWSSCSPSTPVPACGSSRLPPSAAVSDTTRCVVVLSGCASAGWPSAGTRSTALQGSLGCVLRLRHSEFTPRYGCAARTTKW